MRYPAPFFRIVNGWKQLTLMLFSSQNLLIIRWKIGPFMTSVSLMVGWEWCLCSQPAPGTHHSDEERGRVCEKHQRDAAEPALPLQSLPVGDPRGPDRLDHLQHAEGGPSRYGALLFPLASFLQLPSVELSPPYAVQSVRLCVIHLVWSTSHCPSSTNDFFI